MEEIFAKRAVWAVVVGVGGRITLSPSVPLWVRVAKTYALYKDRWLRVLNQVTSYVNYVTTIGDVDVKL